MLSRNFDIYYFVKNPTMLENLCVFRFTFLLEHIISCIVISAQTVLVYIRLNRMSSLEIFPSGNYYTLRDLYYVFLRRKRRTIIIHVTAIRLFPTSVRNRVISM